MSSIADPHVAPAGVATESLDLATVVNVAQAVSGEIVLERLIDRLLVTAIEHGGAERGILALARGDDLHLAAEATTSPNGIDVLLDDRLLTIADLPDSVVSHVV